MGGNAFLSCSRDGKHPALYTPRMPKAVYFAMKDIVLERLATVFEHVAVYPEHPEKEDFGDIDALVSGPKSDFLAKIGAEHKDVNIYDLMHGMAEALGATRRRANCVEICYIGIPIPPEIVSLGTKPTSKPEQLHENHVGDFENYFCQIDLEYVATKYLLDWKLFSCAYTTFSNIVRFGLRPAGFVVQPSGFYTRIPRSMFPKDIWRGEKAPLIFLSNDIAKVLDFIGLGGLKTYGKPIDTAEEYFEWASSMKWFSRKRLVTSASSAGNQVQEKACAARVDSPMQPDIYAPQAQAPTLSWPAEPVEYPESDDDEVFNIVSEVNDMIHQKRSKLMNLHEYIGNKPQWWDFVNTYLSAYPDLGASIPDELVAFKTAIKYFGANGRFHAAFEGWTSELREMRFWEDIKSRLSITPYLTIGDKKEGKAPTKKQLNETILAMPRYIAFTSPLGHSPLPVIQSEPELDEAKQPIFTNYLNGFCGGLTLSDLTDWVIKHAAQVHELDRARTRPERRAKDVVRVQRKQQESMRASWLGWAVWGSVDLTRATCQYAGNMAEGVEKWWGGRQNVKSADFYRS
ncbi:hypothetical protein BT63DRAFT_415669 [Microthyrium microscopicum]|uniref:Uncharacterized protein n=1 Tax=Microthyrium microscopicum TaxID=703497 RepID=A0A6A6U522_9PEZI|nr:hypothetical protein BT63DRAFT_415669 [Microthyrium microscopicum]